MVYKLKSVFEGYKRMPKPCARCGKSFVPTTKSEKLCLACWEAARKARKWKKKK